MRRINYDSAEKKCANRIKWTERNIKMSSLLVWLIGCRYSYMLTYASYDMKWMLRWSHYSLTKLCNVLRILVRKNECHAMPYHDETMRCRQAVVSSTSSSSSTLSFFFFYKFSSSLSTPVCRTFNIFVLWI